MCAIAVRDFGSDLDLLGASLSARIRESRLQFLYDRDSDDARLSHLFDLMSRLENADLSPGDLATPAVLAHRKILARARAKMKGSIPQAAYARSAPMRDLPSARLTRRAARGSWPLFPVDPTPFYDKFVPTVDRKGWVTDSQTSRVVHTLERRLGSLDSTRLTVAGRMALYRAFYTAANELAEIADDSSGRLGDLRSEMWLEYLGIDWRATGIAPQLYWTDVCGLYVWEDLGLDHGHEKAWFKSARSGERLVIAEVLAGMAHEATVYVLDYQAAKARAAIVRLDPPRKARTANSM